MAKSTYIQIRVSEEEKQQIATGAKEKGFDTISAYVLFLIREDLKK